MGPKVSATVSFTFDEAITEAVTLQAEPDVIDFTRRDAGVGIVYVERSSPTRRCHRERSWFA